MKPKILLIDNYDSFTYNIAHLIAQVSGVLPKVVLNDSSEDIELSSYTHLVIGPGPGTPHSDSDVGISKQLYQQALAQELPVLGICLGMQLMVVAGGGKVAKAPIPMHGIEDEIEIIKSEAIFSQVANKFRAVRYHSLSVHEMPEQLEAIAKGQDGTIQMLRHRFKPAWGVQFHPESIRSSYSKELIAGFLAYSSPRADLSLAGELREQTSPDTGIMPSEKSGEEFNGEPQSSPQSEPQSSPQSEPQSSPRSGAKTGPKTEPTHQLLLSEGVDLKSLKLQPHEVYEHFYAKLDYSFWLDSGASKALKHARFSILAGSDHPQFKVLTHRVGARPFLADSLLAGVELDQRSLEIAARFGGFALGYIGYLGYGLAAETLALKHNLPPAKEPDALLAFITQAMIIDHAEAKLYLLGLHRINDRAKQQLAAEFQLRLAQLRTLVPKVKEPAQGSFSEVKFKHSKVQYLELIERCKEYIAKGESYELCLTNQGEVKQQFEPVETYLRLREKAAVPYGALIKTPDFSVLSASPERFLEVGSDGFVESRPIKGTYLRSSDKEKDDELKSTLANSIKDRAENLMIVDLVRNDLSKVCEVGSVKVKNLYEVQSFPTVHQMISTIQGRLRADKTVIDAIKAAFPGGSMTGAPKIRSVEILAELEAVARGIYAGSIGWISFSKAASLSIVIRTLVLDQKSARFGVGGAITRLSQAENEYEETMLKAQTVLAALG